MADNRTLYEVEVYHPDYGELEVAGVDELTCPLSHLVRLMVYVVKPKEHKT